MKRPFAAILGLLGAVSSAQATTVPPQRLAVLSRGANVTSTYERKGDLSLDLKALRDAGFTHVRVFVDLDDLRNRFHQDKLDRLIHQAVDRKMGIIVCMISKKHPWTDAIDVEPIWTAAWRQLAIQNKKVSPAFLFFETANEPSITDGQRWGAIQERLRAMIRSILPDHTLLLTGSPTSMVWSLPPLSPDENVVYTWHLYQPMVFSHQGADWIPEMRPYTGLQYPPNMANIHGLMRPETNKRLTDFEQHGLGMMPHEIAESRKWAEAHNAAVMVDEFGVYSAAPVASRANWLRQARKQIEEAHEGWTVWEYQGGFGIAPLIPRSPILEALVGVGK